MHNGPGLTRQVQALRATVHLGAPEDATHDGIQLLLSDAELRAVDAEV